MTLAEIIAASKTVKLEVNGEEMTLHDLIATVAQHANNAVYNLNERNDYNAEILCGDLYLDEDKFLPEDDEGEDKLDKAQRRAQAAAVEQLDEEIATLTSLFKFDKP